MLVSELLAALLVWIVGSAARVGCTHHRLRKPPVRFALSAGRVPLSRRAFESMTGSRSGLPVMGAALDPRVLVTWCATVGTAWHCRLEGAPRELLVGARPSGSLRHCARGRTSTGASTRSLPGVLPPWPLSGFPAFRLLGVDSRLARPLADVVCGQIACVGVLHQLIFAVLAGDALPLGVVVGVVVIVVRLFARERDDRS